MRYLKLFEGGIEQDIIDEDYIEMCFVDFVDEDNFKLYVGDGKKTCPECDGDETVECGNCDGRGQVDCYDC